ncbi:MAG TPA: sulfite reductase flavoprotein subunit alpha, partial [Verrucomicrobiae bacterium]
MEIKYVPKLPSAAPFSAEQRAWLDGFLAGLFNELIAPGPAEKSAAQPDENKSLLVLVGSQSGSAEGLAKQFAKSANAKGYKTRVQPLNDCARINWASETRCIVITSTWGDGDPPDNAVEGWAWLSSEVAPRLEHLHYAVLGLGDLNYSDFCGAAKKFDTRLEALGAKRLVPRAECDVDYESAAREWLEKLWVPLSAGKADPKGLTVIPVESAGAAEFKAEIAPAGFSRTNPFAARLKTNRRLNGAGSAKDTRHLEILLGKEGPTYAPGDALGVVAENCPVLVEHVLAAFHFNGDEIVSLPGDIRCTIHELLLKHFVISQATIDFARAAAERAKNSEWLAMLAQAKTATEQWLSGRDLADVLQACPAARFSPEEVPSLLRKLQPRLYSISSSPKAHPGEVHLTVGTVRYQAHGRERKGVASCWLAERVTLNETPLPVFVQTSHG